MPGKRLALRCLFASLILVLSVALLEGLCSGLACWRYGTLSVDRLNEIDSGNTFTHEMKQASFAETVKPHPWLGIVPGKQATEAGWLRAEVDAFPIEKDSSKFTVLLSGGSAAMLMGASAAPNSNKTFLEEALSAKLGRDAVVLNAAEGATVQPRHTIAALLYGHVADAVIVMDGFNECTRFTFDKPSRMEQPSSWFEDLNPLVTGDYERIGASWQAAKLRAFSKAHRWRSIFFATKLLRDSIEQPEVKGSAVVFDFPADWTGDQRRAFNMETYKRCICATHAIAADLGIKSAHFIQPCPAIGKILTEEEKRVVGDLSYRERYQWMTDELLDMNEHGVPVVSLLDCYAGMTDTLYVDSIHSRVGGDGYRLMAERIAAELARLWNESHGERIELGR